MALSELPLFSIGSVSAFVELTSWEWTFLWNLFVVQPTASEQPRLGSEPCEQQKEAAKGVQEDSNRFTHCQRVALIEWQTHLALEYQTEGRFCGLPIAVECHRGQHNW